MTTATILLAPDSVSSFDFYKDAEGTARRLLQELQYVAMPPIEVDGEGEDAAEECFDLTNNPYRQGERLEKYGRERSLSVGDIVSVFPGTAWLCASVGWVEIK